ncbi:MAG: TerB family tellurite resistance protein [Kiritimatiellae bacterium]|nr:TerB family tellurite resistance protein [Kiritimatiellia bacterium]
MFDKTSGELEPVISSLETFQEPDSSAYQHHLEVGQISPDQGFIDWVRLGVIFPDILQPPYSGERDLVAIIRMIDLNNPPPIAYGFHEEHPGLLWQESLAFTWIFTEKGYNEVAENRDEAMAITIKIGIVVAMADGNLDDKEGDILKQWVVDAIESYSDEKQQTLKALCNNAMKDAYTDALNDNLSLNELTQRLNEIAEKATKYEAIKLCFDVMVIDGVANKEKTRVINKLSEALELDIEEIEKIRDQKIIDFDTSIANHTSIEELLGIEANWNKERVKKHLRSEFQKWNNRITTLTKKKERDNAQRMLDLIAETRRKYV